MDQPDEPRTAPPSPVEVARRALILCGVVVRSAMETYDHKEQRRDTVAAIREWFDDLDLWPHLDPEEAKTVRAPLGKLAKSRRVRGTWYVEGLAILAWALGRSDFPPHDRKVFGPDVTDALDFLEPEAARLLAAPTLRSSRELEAAREWFYDVHVTLRQFLFHNGTGRLARWIGNYVKTLRLERKAVMAGQDLAFAAQPLAQAQRERLEDWEPVVCERHRAVMWLVGSDEPYTEIAVDT